MPNNWKTYKLGKLIKVNSNSIKKGDFGWINYIDIKSVGTGYYDNPLKINFNEAPSRARRRLENGNTVISSVRPNLKSFFYCREIPDNAIASTGFVVLEAIKIEPRFLYYLTTNDNYINYLVQSCSGSAYPAFSPKVILDSEVTIPELTEQKSIASILSAIDDKIENNLAINKTLEEMAMALYKHWFVDFGPFQDGEFVDSELGRIPKGWEVMRLDDIITVKRGGSPRPIQDFLAPSGLPWVKISDATASNSPYLMETKEFIKEEGLRKTVLLKKGSLILSNSASPGIPKFLELDACIHDGWLHFPEINRFGKYLLFLTFLRIKEELIQKGNGSVFTNLKTDILKSQLVTLPPKEIEEKINSQIKSFFKKIRENSIENQTLTQLRDTLLPKLISGEVRLKEFRE